MSRQKSTWNGKEAILEDLIAETFPEPLMFQEAQRIINSKKSMPSYFVEKMQEY